jgi:ribonuclease PH
MADRAILVTGDRGASVALAQAFVDQRDMCSLSPRVLHVQRTVIAMEQVS